jgi:hypothetical protein
MTNNVKLQFKSGPPVFENPRVIYWGRLNHGHQLSQVPSNISR